MTAIAADLQSEYEALIQFLYLSPVGLAQIDRDGEIRMINPLSAQLLMPLSRDANLSNLFAVLEPVLPDLRHMAATYGLPSGKICDGVRIRLSAAGRGNGDPQVLSLTLLKLDADRMMAVLSDITKQVNREAQLRQNERLFHAIASGTSDYALVGLDQRGHVVAWNPSIGRVLGFDEDAVVGQSFSMFHPGDAFGPDRVAARLREAADGGWSLDEGWRARADGSCFWGSGMLAMLPDSQGGHPDTTGSPEVGEATYCLVIREIGRSFEVRDLRCGVVSSDLLTGITNRRSFYEVAALEIDRWSRSPDLLSMILVDVEDSRAVRDRHGRAAGDAVLRDVADAMTQVFGPVDTIARIGCETFAVLMPSTSSHQARAAMERLRIVVASRRVAIDGVDIAYAITAAATALDDPAGGLDAWMGRADHALARAHASGRDGGGSRPAPLLPVEGA